MASAFDDLDGDSATDLIDVCSVDVGVCCGVLTIVVVGVDIRDSSSCSLLLGVVGVVGTLGADTEFGVIDAIARMGFDI